MKNFQQIAAGVDVLPLCHAIKTQPELWDQNNWRKNYAGSPHLDISDIWLRYSSPNAVDDESNTTKVVNDVAPVWYPAMGKLWQARPIVLDLMRRVEAYELGRLLITKLPPGGRILPHSDAQGAYTDQDGSRYHVVLQGLPGSLFRSGDETVNMQTGSVWWFDHTEEHEVINNSADDRIHLLVDLKVMR